MFYISTSDSIVIVYFVKVMPWISFSIDFLYNTAKNCAAWISVMSLNVHCRTNLKKNSLCCKGIQVSVLFIQKRWTMFEQNKKHIQNILNPIQFWINIHTHGSSENREPSTSKHTAGCSSKNSTWLKKLRDRSSTRFRQIDQSSVSLVTPSTSVQTGPKTPWDSRESSRRSPICSIKFYDTLVWTYQSCIFSRYKITSEKLVSMLRLYPLAAVTHSCFASVLFVQLS